MAVERLILVYVHGLIQLDMLVTVSTVISVELSVQVCDEYMP